MGGGGRKRAEEGELEFGGFVISAGCVHVDAKEKKKTGGRWGVVVPVGRARVDTGAHWSCAWRPLALQQLDRPGQRRSGLYRVANFATHGRNTLLHGRWGRSRRLLLCGDSDLVRKAH